MKFSSAFAFSALFCIVGCSPSQGTTQGKSATPASESPVEACMAATGKQVECTDQFIPMLVDLRIKHNLPPGIADKGKDDEGRNKLIAEAKEEFKTDGSPENRSKMCEKMAPKLQEKLATIKQCLEQKGCAEFVACIKPMQEAFFTGK